MSEPSGADRCGNCGHRSHYLGKDGECHTLIRGEDGRYDRCPCPAFIEPAPSTPTEQGPPIEQRAVLLTEHEARVAGIAHLWHMTPQR